MISSAMHLKVFNSPFIFFFCLVVSWVQCVKILGIFPFPASSHFTLGNALMKGLAEGGNDVTTVTTRIDKEPPKNGTFKTVLLTGFTEQYKETLKDLNLMESEDENSVKHPYIMQQFMFELIEKTFSHPNVQNLLNSQDKFDVVVVEKFYNDAFFVFAHHFKAPLIIFSAIGASPCINNIVGNPEPYAYIPYFVSTFSSNMNFLQRMHNAYLHLFQEVVDRIYFLPRQETAMKKYFPDAPSIDELHQKVSLVFIMAHESFSQPVPLVPNIKPIGGFHVRPPKALPKDLKQLLDDSTEGVVYFCLGSNLRSNELPDATRNILLTAFGKLKEKVLMKWEEDHLLGQPPNVIVKKWLPQSDLLAHPNVKLFITHGGLLSTTEAVYHGVPLLVVPFFADQHSNAISAVANGYALNLPYKDPGFTEERLSSYLDELLHNPKYRENAKLRSQLFHDRPLSPIGTVQYWVEFVARHKGAYHLGVAGVRLPWYKYYLVDVIVFLLVAILLVLYTLRYLVKLAVGGKKKKLKKN